MIALEPVRNDIPAADDPDATVAFGSAADVGDGDPREVAAAQDTVAARPGASAAAEATGSWPPVEDLLVELCRRRGAALAGVEVIVDCDPPGLLIAAEDVRKLNGSLALLVDSALAGPELAEVDISARPAGSEEAPLLMVSIRAVARGEEEGSPVPLRDPEELALTRLLVERTGGTLLMAQREGGVRRLTLGLGVRWKQGRPVLRLAGGRSLRAVIADDSAMLRRVARRLLERRGYDVVEAPGTSALIAHLDAEGGEGRRPDVVLVDRGWIDQAADGGVGLVEAIEKTVSARRVVLLEPAGSPERSPVEGFRGLDKPFGLAALQEVLDPEGDDGSRNDEAERPNSLSRW